MNFTSCGPNGLVEGFCIIKSVEKKTTQRGSFYLDLTISDSSGEMNAKLWDYKEPTVKYAPFDFVKVRGTVVPFNDTDQFRIDRIRHVIDSDNANIADYIESAENSGEVMLANVIRIVNGFEDEELKRLVLAVIDEYREKLLFWPAALKLHHAIRSGLLMHTLSILRLAGSVCSIYSCVNKDLLFAGVILHDIAKIEELKTAETGVASDYTVRGNLLGHLVMGAINIDRIGRDNNISEETLTLVEHMLISHHGVPEFGAAQYPMFIEAELLSELDNLDAKMYLMSHVIDDTPEGGFTQRQWSLDNRKLYNHGRGGDVKVNICDDSEA